ncbi:MAG: S1C family serine protease [Ginsengibacter sp.]
MNENVLFDAIERYRNGEMGPEEKALFEELRRKNPEIDQVAAENSFMLTELDRISQIKKFKRLLNEVENKLENEEVISERNKKTGAKIIYLWNRYRRTIAVAAAIAVLVSISTATFFSVVSENKKAAALTPLVNNKLVQFERKLNQIEHKLNDAAAEPVKPQFEANFMATGFLLDGKGYIITNAHVVNNAKNLIVENKKGVQYSAKSIYNNPLNDLAILQITDTSFKKVTNLPYTFPKTSFDLAEPIYTLGYPREEIVYGQGYLSAQSGYFGDTTSYQISISVNPGNSGGPVLTRNGEIIGIISSKETKADGVVFAVKSESIYSAIEAVKKGQNINIKLPSSNSLKGLDRVQQIKKIDDYVYKVKGN